MSTTITSLTLPFPLDLPVGRALDLREASAMMEAGVPGGRNGVLTHDARATQVVMSKFGFELQVRFKPNFCRTEPRVQFKVQSLS